MEKLVTPDPAFWRGKRVALTGHTGFKGAWLALLLHRLGARVFGFALTPDTQPNLYSALDLEHVIDSRIADIRHAATLADWLHETQPDIVFHLAAQALVRASYNAPLVTFDTNVMGTANLLDAVRQVASVRAVVVVTTDKVYRNRESGQAYTEDDELGGHDPYSASKAATELVTASYRASFLSQIGLATARAGNVIGGGDWSPDRLLPDAVRAWHAGQVLQIRRPDAVRPWQHVLEPVCAYLVLAQGLYVDPSIGRAYNLGPEAEGALSVRDVVELARAGFAGATVEYALQTEGPHEAGLLHLHAGLARRIFGVRPRWDVAQAVRRSVEWYRQFYAGKDARSLCEADISAYFEQA